MLAQVDAPFKEQVQTPANDALAAVEGIVQARLELTPGQQTAVVLWVAHTYVYEFFKVTPKLFVTAIRHGIGKTECMDVVEALSCNGIKRQGSTTESAISRMLGARGRVTLCLDQLDGLDHEQRRLINLLIDGFEVGAMKEMSEQTGAGKTYQPRGYIIGFPQALGKIGELPDAALTSRCITIRMQPATEERQQQLFEAQNVPLVDKLNDRKVGAAAFKVRKALWEALRPQGKEMASRWYRAPCKCDPRTATMWQPLFAVAELAGGDWPARARAAFLELRDEGESTEPQQVRFLRHVLKRLPAGVAYIKPEELLSQVSLFEGSHVSTKQQANWLRSVGAPPHDPARWPGFNNGEPCRVYVVAELHEAAKRWRVAPEPEPLREAA